MAALEMNPECELSRLGANEKKVDNRGCQVSGSRRNGSVETLTSISKLGGQGVLERDSFLPYKHHPLDTTTELLLLFCRGELRAGFEIGFLSVALAVLELTL